MPLRTRLDKAAVLQAAVELVNEEGESGLSLSKLADRLGIQTPSLYNHISGLPGLQRDLALANVNALGEKLIESAIGKTGRQALMAMAEAYRSYIHQYPGLYQISLRASGNQNPIDQELKAAEDRIVRTGLAVMASFGLTGEDAVHAVRGFRSLVHGFATLEISGGFGLPLDCDESFQRLITYFANGLEKTASGV